ncbi:hypothetical protein C8R45DRAFT_843592, partial [Mycena sanguinolenta]
MNIDEHPRVLFLNPTPTDTVYTRATDPFNPERVAKILELVRIGSDLTEEQKGIVRSFVTEHADVFALSAGEVCVAEGAEYAPRIPADATFSTRAVPQRPWTKPQTVDVFRQVDEMVAAGVLRRIDPRDVKCVNPITLAEK